MAGDADGVQPSTARLIKIASAPSVGSSPRNLVFGGDFFSDRFERSTDKARDVHLRDADLLRDLRLRQPLEESQVENCALAVVENAEAGLEQRAVLRDLVLVLDLSERLERIELLAVL